MACLCSGAVPGGPQYCPQGWGNAAYQQWQAPSPHDPSECILILIAILFCLCQFLSSFFFLLPIGKAADPNAAWAAYYAQYYGQQPGGAMPGQTPGAAAAAAGDQSQAAQTAGGQPDYTKAWEEYYKKMGMSKK